MRNPEGHSPRDWRRHPKAPQLDIKATPEVATSPEKKSMWGFIVGWAVVGIVGPLIVAIGFGVLSMNPPEVKVALGCFGAGYLIVLTKVAWWGAFERTDPVLQRGVFISLLFATIGVMWFASSTFATSKATKPPSGEFQRPLTLEELFTSDFPDLNKWSNSGTFTDPSSGAQLVIQEQMHLDYQGYSRFLSFYLPPSSVAYSAGIWIANHSGEIIDQFDKNEIVTRGATDQQGISTKELKFSGRVYVYTLSDFTLKQQASLDEEFRKNGLALAIRGGTYMTFTNMQRQKH